MYHHTVDMLPSEVSLSWNGGLYGGSHYGDYSVPSADWTTMSSDLDTPSLSNTFDIEEHKELDMGLGTSPGTPPIEVAEADSTEHCDPMMMYTPVAYQQRHRFMVPVASGGYVSRYYPPAGMYPAPALHVQKQEQPNYTRPYRVYMNGPNMTSYQPPAMQSPDYYHQPYVVQPQSYDENLPAFQNMIPPTIESMPMKSEPRSSDDLLNQLVMQVSPLTPSSPPELLIKQEVYDSPAQLSPLDFNDLSGTEFEQIPPLECPTTPRMPVTPLTSPEQSSPALNQPLPLQPLPAHTQVLQQQQQFHQLSSMQQLQLQSQQQRMPPKPLALQAIAKGQRPTGVTTSDFGCLECGKVFSRQCGLTQHVKWRHTGVKPFRCYTCGKCFPYEDAMQMHVLRHTSDQKPHKCTVCPKQFYHKNDLRRHMYQHNGEAPHVCKYCKKAFARNDHLHSHELSHERKTERRLNKKRLQEQKHVFDRMIKIAVNGMTE